MTLQQTLALIAIGLAAAKAATASNPQAQQILGYITTADDAVQSALTAIQQAHASVDPTLLKPIAPLP
jgi:hypothetical protein